MSYSLGIDVGTTFVAAAVTEATTVEMFPLTDQAALAPAVVYLGDDGMVATGDAAYRNIKGNPGRIGQGLMNRLGDPTPVQLGQWAYEVTDLISVLLRDVVHQVTKTHGKPPEHVVLTHPASWGPFRLALFETAARQAGLRKPTMVSEARAAAARYATSRPWNDGETVAVYDLGGSTFNATVLRKHSGEVQTLGTPQRVEWLGGGDLDEAILSHVEHTAGSGLGQLDEHRPETLGALAKVRQDCIRAKEALSVDIETTFPVVLRGQRLDVRLARSDVEDLARGLIESTINGLSEALRSAYVHSAALSAVLLVGGSSSIPLVAERVSAQLGRPVIVDAHPDHVVALGAATLAGQVDHHDEPLHEGRHYRSQPAESQLTSNGGVAASRTPAMQVAGATTQPAVQSFVPSQSTTGLIPAQRRRNLVAVPHTPVREKAVAATRTALGSNGAGTARGTIQTPAPVAPPRRTPSPPSPPPVAPPPPDKQRQAPKSQQSTLAALTERASQPRILIGTGIAVALAGSILLALFAGGDDNPPAKQPGLAAPAKPQPSAVASVESPVAMPTAGATIKVGSTPNFVTISPNGQYAYIANGSSQHITVLDTALNQVTATIPITTGPPQFLTFAPDGRTLYVTVSNEQGTIHAIDVLDTRTNAVIATIPQAGMPFRVAVSPDGKRLFVPNHMLPFVSVIDTATNTVIGQINVAPNPHWVTFSPDGSRAYTANHESDLVSVIDTTTLNVLATIPVGNSPHSIAVNPHLPLVANVNYDGHSVSEINATTNKVVATIPVEQNPQDIVWTPDGRYAYVVNHSSNTVSVIDTTTNQVTKTIPTGTSPTSIALQPNGRQAYVTNLDNGTVTVINLTR